MENNFLYSLIELLKPKPLQSHVKNTVNLLKDGCTVPFIERYRRNQTGTMNIDNLLLIQSKVDDHQEAIKLRDLKLKKLSDDSILTKELELLFNKCIWTREVEDLYESVKITKSSKSKIISEYNVKEVAINILHNEMNYDKNCNNNSNDKHKDNEHTDNNQYNNRIMVPKEARVTSSSSSSSSWQYSYFDCLVYEIVQYLCSDATIQRLFNDSILSHNVTIKSNYKIKRNASSTISKMKNNASSSASQSTKCTKSASYNSNSHSNYDKYHGVLGRCFF